VGVALERFDVFVVGGGGTGSEVALSLAKRSDLRVGLAERDKLGGECNHYGCIPTKVMLRSERGAESARDVSRFGVHVQGVHVDFPAVIERARRIIQQQSGAGARPFEELGVTVVPQEVRLVGPHRLEAADGTQIEAHRIVLATGTEAIAPPLDGLEGTPYWTNKEAIWSPTEIPESLLVLGSGAIGIEFAQMYARFGSRVTIVESEDRILPSEDADAGAAFLPVLEKEGIQVRVGAQATRAEHSEGAWVMELEGRDPLTAAELLVATGRRPCLAGHDLEAAGVELDGRGYPVADETLRTTGERIWAAGDATGELLFTHVGDYEARVVWGDILGSPRPRDYRVIPRVTFCEPEVASVGLTEEKARDAGRDVATSVVAMEDNERALIEGQTHGMVKLVADRRTGDLLGGHIVGETAGDMIHEVAAAMTSRVPISAMGDMVHAYPTLSESVKWAFIRLAEGYDAPDP